MKIRDLYEADDDMIDVIHVTRYDNLKSIMREGLKPSIGENSADFGEEKPYVHLFIDMDHAEDAVANWDMPSWENEDEELIAITLSIPKSWTIPDSKLENSVLLVDRTIPPSMIKNIQRNF